MNIHICNIYVQYGKCDFFLYELLNQVEQQVFLTYFAGSVQCTYILYLPTMYILFILLCQQVQNQRQQLSQKDRNKYRPTSFQWSPQWRPRLYCYCFWSLTLHGSGTRTAIFWLIGWLMFNANFWKKIDQWPYIAKTYSVHAIQMIK